MKHPILRVASATDLDNSILDEIEALGRAIAEVFKFDPVDVEIVGSYANGCAALHSDIDIAIPAQDKETRDKIKYKCENYVIAAFHLREAFHQKWGCRVDLSVSPTDFGRTNKEVAEKLGVAVYSLFERKQYGTPLDMVHFNLAFNPITQLHEPTPYTKDGEPVASIADTAVGKMVAAWDKDEWETEVPKWRKIYGDKFLETTTRLRPDGQTELIQV